ncbi:hypothetical protein N7G274_004466 [Stereocaulon virgatum]|uniref:Uncharacterized protein n=1 Tax=Stereocaulon virgatum TaxID=373712 RepID=A0ABR4ADS6_9LECA
MVSVQLETERARLKRASATDPLAQPYAKDRLAQKCANSLLKVPNRAIPESCLTPPPPSPRLPLPPFAPIQITYIKSPTSPRPRDPASSPQTQIKRNMQPTSRYLLANFST